MREEFRKFIFENKAPGFLRAVDEMLSRKAEAIFEEVVIDAGSVMLENNGISIEAQELVHHADNDHNLYKTSHEPIVATLKKKVANGTYDHEKAKKLWAGHADRAAQSYHKEFGSPGSKWHEMFSKSYRNQAASEFADRAREDHLREDIEQIDELSRKTLASYVKKAEKSKEKLNPDAHKARKRDESIGLANAKIEYHDIRRKPLFSPAKKKKREGYQNWPGEKKKYFYSKEELDLEVEQIDELSRKTVKSYLDKATAPNTSGMIKVKHLRSADPRRKSKELARLKLGQYDRYAIVPVTEINEIAIERGLQDHEPRIVSGVKGMKSRPFAKKFRNHAHMEKWFDSEAASDHEVHYIERA